MKAFRKIIWLLMLTSDLNTSIFSKLQANMFTDDLIRRFKSPIHHWCQSAVVQRRELYPQSIYIGNDVIRIWPIFVACDWLQRAVWIGRRKCEGMPWSQLQFKVMSNNHISRYKWANFQQISYIVIQNVNVNQKDYSIFFVVLFLNILFS